jgi:hypothetical protein
VRSAAGQGLIRTSVLRLLDLPHGQSPGRQLDPGKLDLPVQLIEPVTQDSANVAVNLAFGNGDGSFAGFGSSVPLLLSATSSHRLGVTTAGVFAVDLNRDRVADLLTNENGTMKSTFGNGDGTFQPAVIALDQPNDTNQMALVDVNEDGKLDLLADANYLSIFPGNGDGRFGSPLANYSSPDSQGMTVADYNGDNKTDVAFTGAEYGKTSILFSKGGGHFAGVPVLQPRHPRLERHRTRSICRR